MSEISAHGFSMSFFSCGVFSRSAMRGRGSRSPRIVRGFGVAPRRGRSSAERHGSFHDPLLSADQRLQRALYSRNNKASSLQGLASFPRFNQAMGRAQTVCRGQLCPPRCKQLHSVCVYAVLYCAAVANAIEDNTEVAKESCTHDLLLRRRYPN